MIASMRPVAGLAVLYLAVVTCWQLVLPPFEGPDELANYDYARYVAVTGRLPDHVPGKPFEGGFYKNQWIHEGLYFWLFGQVLGGMGVAHAPIVVQGANPRASFIGGDEAPLLLHAVPISGDLARGLAAGRMLNGLMGLGTIICVFFALAHVLGSSTRAALGTGCLLLVPEFGVRHAFVSNDPLALLCASAAATLTLRWNPRVGVTSDDGAGGSKLWIAAVIGLLSGCAIAAKLTAGIVVLMMPLACWMWRREPGARIRLHLAAWAAGLIAAGSWPFVRNWMVFGDPLATPLKKGIITLLEHKVLFDPTDVHSYVEFVRLVFRSFWATVGWAGFRPPVEWVWYVYVAITLVCIAAFPIGLLAARRGASAPAKGAATKGAARQGESTERSRAIIIAGIVVLVDVLAFVLSLSRVPGHSARYLLPITVPAMVVVAYGFQTVAASLRPRVGQAALSVMPWAIVVALALAWLASWREVVLAYHFGWTS
jgi:hypothetical protein